MNGLSSKSLIISSLFWKLLERGGTQLIQFIVQIVLARLLLPEMYGIVALVTVFISLARVFVQSGLNTALIQKKEADDVDFSSVFYVSLFLSALLYTLLFVFAPTIASFYRHDQLALVLRVLGITLFFGAINGVQEAYVSRHMMFKELFKRSVGALLVSGAAGITAAYAGLGIWALVIQQLTNQVTVTVIMWFTIRWRPIRVFSFSRIRCLFSFGSKLLLSSLVSQIFNDIKTLIIGRVYNSSMLGFYNRGEQIPSLVVSNINSSIQSVMFPALSAYQDDKQKVKAMMRRGIMTSGFFVFPLMIGLSVVAESMVQILLTDKWLPSVPYMRLFCCAYAFMPINTANLQAINALGRSDIFLKLEVVKRTISVLVLVITVPMGVYAIAVGNTITGVLFTVINAYPNKRLLGYEYFDQIRDVVPSLAISIVMGGVVHCVKFLPLAGWHLLLTQIVSGIFIYAVLAKVLKLSSFNYLHMTVRDMRNRKRQGP